MTACPLPIGARLIMAAEHFQEILTALKRQGYEAVGPTLRDGHLIYGDLTGVADLPVGWTFDAEAGASA